MKTTVQLFIAFFISALLFGCGKGTEVPVPTKEEEVAKLFSGNGNKVWRLKAVKENNVDVVLTSHQLQYTKTYTLVSPSTIQGTFKSSDSETGDWSMKGSMAMQEVFMSAAGFASRDYTIVSITDQMVTMYYVSNNKKIEEQYRAY